MRSWPHIPDAARSLRARVFFAILVAGMVPVVALVGYLAYVEAAEEPTWDGPDAEAVYAAWALGSDPSADPVLAEVQASIAAQREGLGARRAEEVLRHVELLIGASEGAYDYGTETALSELEAEAAMVDGEYANGDRVLSSPLTPDALDALRADGFYWGSGWYQEPQVEPGADSSDEGSWMAYWEQTPIVAWMIGPDTAEYVQVPAGSYVSGGYTPNLYWWLAGLFVAGLLVVAGFALFVSTIALRGVDKPLRLVADEAESACSGGDAAPAPLVGPPVIRRLTQAVNRLVARSSRAQRAEQSFLLSVSHELKTPLTSLRGYGEGLKDGALDAATAGDVIVTESSRLERFVQDLLDSARFGRGEFTVKREAVELESLACDVVERHRALAESLGVGLGVQGDARASAVADPDRVVQVVSNLVENALRCSPSGGSVTVSVAPGMVVVTDTGPGLGVEDLEHAFERFYLHNRYGRDRKVGTGLGLAIAKDLVEKMDGSVSVASEVGLGSTFTVRLPIARAEQSDA